MFVDILDVLDILGRCAALGYIEYWIVELRCLGGMKIIFICGRFSCGFEMYCLPLQIHNSGICSHALSSVLGVFSKSIFALFFLQLKFGDFM